MTTNPGIFLLYPWTDSPTMGGMVVELLLHKKCHPTTVDLILSKYGVSIVQKRKNFVAIPIAGLGAALAVYDTCLDLELIVIIFFFSPPPHSPSLFVAGHLSCSYASSRDKHLFFLDENE